MRHPLCRLAAGLLALTAFAACSQEPNSTANRQTARALNAIAGGQVRVVWCQDQDPRGTDLFAESDRFLLMGFDSADGRGERPLLPQPGNYSRPLLTPSGRQIVFSDRQRRHFFALDWNGQNPVDLGEGFAVDAWVDPQTGREWVYFGAEPRAVSRQDVPAYSSISRCPIDQPSRREVVWTGTPIMQMTENNFLLSADGTRASLVAPGQCGVAALDRQTWKPFGKGCWPAVAPDGTHRFWLFEGGHRAIHFFDAEGVKLNRVALNDAPGMDGLEVFHPRWSNDPRLFAVAGPLRIPGGGPGVEIFVGRFTPDFSAVEQWVQVSRNAKADFFPDVWIASTVAPASAPPPNTPPLPSPTAAPAPAAATAAPPLIVSARLVAASRIPPPATLAPYRRALIGNRYEVVQVISGALPDREFIGAHWGIREAEILPDAERPIGTLYTMTLRSIDDDEELRAERLIYDGPADALLLFYDAGPPAPPE